MKKIVAFAGSNSSISINKQLVEYASSLVNDIHVKILDLNDFQLPLYGVDYQNSHGIPDNAHKFLEHITTCDGIILSLAEHNGVYSSVFKNLFDWMSVINGKLWSNKPMLLMATSPGARGGLTVLEIAKGRFPNMGGNIITDFSCPSFQDNFSDGCITNIDLDKVLKTKVKLFQDAL